MALVQDGGETIPETDAELKEFLKDENFVHFVGMMMRPGILECLTLLEHQNYQPGTPRNDLFVMRIIEWEGLTWVAISIPANERHLMEAAADTSGLRISDGVPVMMGGGTLNRFPMHGDTVFSLSNVSGHPVYKNNPEIDRAMREGEMESATRIRENFSKQK